jgi:hypothetical protein
MGRPCSMHGVVYNSYKIVFGKREVRLGDLDYRWEDNVDIDLKEMRNGDMD